MSATILLSVMAASMAVPQSSSVFAEAALAPRDGDGVVVVKLFVAPDRKVEDCAAVLSELSDADNARVCNKLRGKRASAPATADGRVAYGTLTYVVAGTTTYGSSELQASLPADVVLDVASLPGGARKESVSVNVLLDQAGKVTKCEAADYYSAAYVKTACATLKEQALEARKGSDGSPVPYVDTVTVDFVTRQASL